MKNKNPLYVVKGKDIEEASGLFDLVVKKLNLQPVIDVFNSLLKMLLEQVKSYPTFVAIKELIDELIVKYFGMLKKFGIA